MARSSPTYTPEQVLYGATCAYAERLGVAPRFVELFRDDVADPEAVDTLADRDPGIRVELSGLADPLGYLTVTAREVGLAHVLSQVLDQLPTPLVVSVPIRGTVS